MRGFFAQNVGSTTTRIVERFDQGTLKEPAALAQVDGFVAGADGWYLPPHTSGTFVYHIAKDPGAGLVANVWLYLGGQGVSGRLSASLDGSTPQVLAHDSQLYGDAVRFPKGTGEAAAVDLQMDATNNGNGRPLVIDQLIWGVGSGVAPEPPPVYACAALGLLGGLLVARPPWGRRRLAVGLGLAALLAVAAYSRFQALYLAAPYALDPDAQYYRIFASQFRWWPPWENGLFSAAFNEREPFFPAVAHEYFVLLGPSDFHLKVVSSTLSVAAVALAVTAARTRLGWPGSLAVGALMVLNAPLIVESTRGLRLELETCLLLGFYSLAGRAPALRAWLEAAGTGLVGAALALTKSAYLPVLMLAGIASYLGRYRPPRRALALAALMLAIMVAAEGGHRTAMYVRTGDPFADTATEARGFANLEKFELHHALPHPELFPTEAEYREPNEYAGPHLTTLQYLFELHSWDQVLLGELLGLADIFQAAGGFYLPGGVAATPLPAAVDTLVRWIVLAGLVGMIWTARRQPANLVLVILVLGSLAPVAFLYHQGLLERYRLTMEVYPLGLIAGAWLLERLIARASTPSRPRPEGPPAPARGAPDSRPGSASGSGRRGAAAAR